MSGLTEGVSDWLPKNVNVKVGDEVLRGVTFVRCREGVASRDNPAVVFVIPEETLDAYSAADAADQGNARDALRQFIQEAWAGRHQADFVDEYRGSLTPVTVGVLGLR